MNERIKELAEQAGFDVEDRAGNGEIWFDEGWYTSIVERFAELVRQDEREACIDIVMQNVSPAMARECEDDIRARSNNRTKTSRDICGND
jgi:hypothetical protein